MSALQDLRSELAKIDPALSSLSTIVADSSDSKSLDSLTSSTKVVITSAGPFSKYGSLPVKSCALHGTHCCDITGESDWVREMIDKYSILAVKSGARIVHFCGHDCIPWDLCVQQLDKALRQKDKSESLAEVRFYDEINISPSGGTLATVVNSLSDRKKYKSQVGFDPLLLVSELSTANARGDVINKQGEAKTVAKVQSNIAYSQEFKSWLVSFYEQIY